MLAANASHVALRHAKGERHELTRLLGRGPLERAGSYVHAKCPRVSAPDRGDLRARMNVDEKSDAPVSPSGVRVANREVSPSAGSLPPRVAVLSAHLHAATDSALLPSLRDE